MYGDIINDLPIDENSNTKHEDLSLLVHILRPETPVISASFNFMKLIAISLLFLILTIPKISEFIGFYTKNNVFLVKGILIVIFLIFYVIIDRFI